MELFAYDENVWEMSARFCYKKVFLFFPAAQIFHQKRLERRLPSMCFLIHVVCCFYCIC